MVLLEPTAAEKAALRKEKLEKKSKSFVSHLTTWIIRLLVFILVVLAVFLFVLSRINGEDDSFRTSLEKYFSDHTSYRVNIGTLNKFTVLPEFVFDVADVQVYDQHTQRQLFTLGAMHLSSGLLDLVSREKSVKNFYIDELRINSAVTGGSPVFIEEAYFQPPQKDKPDTGETPFMIHAVYGDIPVTAAAHFEYNRQADGSYSYTLKQSSPASLQWLDYKLSFLHDTQNQERKLSNMQLFKAGSDDVLLTGDVVMRNAGIHADIKHGDALYKTTLKFGSSITGEVTLDLFDFAKIEELVAILPLSSQNQQEEKGSEPVSFGDSSVHIDVSMNNFRNGDLVIGSVKFPISLDKGKLDISRISGTVFGGTLKGSLSLDSQTPENKDSFKALLDLTGINYENFSSKVQGGNGSLKVDLTSNGITENDILNNMNGQITFIGANATMPVSALHFWGNGLVNALLPSIDPEAETTVNCSIADFKVENGVANTQSLFLDTKRLTVNGEGHISLLDQKVKIKLKPSSKDTSLLKFDTAIKISGDLSNPSIGPDAMSLGLTSIKALAGAINPAFLLVTMSDLGLSKNHPCHAFLPEQKKEHEDAIEQKKQERAEALKDKKANE